VTGAGFVTLAATLSAIHTIPVAGLAVIIGIDRFMSEARALTSTISNAVACIVVSKWERACDHDVLTSELAQGYAKAEETLESGGELAGAPMAGGVHGAQVR